MNTWSLRYFIWQMIYPYRWYIAILMFIAFFAAATSSIESLAIKWLVDAMQGCEVNRTIACIVPPLLLYLTNSFFVTILFRVQHVIDLKVEPALESETFTFLMKHTVGHSYLFFQEHFAGALVGQMRDVARGITDLTRMFVARFFKAICMIAIALVTLSFVSISVAIIVMVWLIASGINIVYAAPRLHALADAAAEQRSAVTGYATDVISNILAVYLFGGKKHEEGNIRTKLSTWIAADRKSRWELSHAFVWQVVLWALREILIVVWIIWAFSKGTITAGDAVLIVTLTMVMANEIWLLAPELSQALEFIGSVSQGIRTIMVPHALHDAENAQQLTVSHGAIVYDQVSFSYRHEISVLRNISVTILSGQKVGLVGYSGSGKSTFVHLLLRLIEQQQGSITIDGQNIQQVTCESLREVIAFVPQDPSLFHRTLLENIRYGHGDASVDDVVHAAQHAHADDFIRTLPQGYDSLIGDRGVKLSGGQRQRIALARAFLKPAKILVMDEATSALDSVTERYIQESVKKLMQHHTTIVIAHRLTTLLMMDRILVFDHGRIIEDGTHHDLLAQKGRYWELWNSHIDGFIQDKPS